MTTTATPPTNDATKELHDGQLLEVQAREFEIVELSLRVPAKAKAQPATDPAGAGAAPPAADPAAAAPASGKRADDPDGDGDSESMEIAISSEYPVKRWFGTEILDHSPDAIDLSRAKRGLSFLLDHDSRDVVGIIENIRVDEDKKLRGNVRFSANAPAQAVKRDIKDGIRRFVSVGYMVKEFVLEKSSDDGNTYRATGWTPLEASSVGVPADPTVGHNRKEHRLFPVQIRSLNPASKPNPSEVAMPVEVKEIQTAAAEIVRLGKRHNIDSEEIAKMLAEGVTPAEASQRILATISERGGKPLAQPNAEQVDAAVELTDREQKEYNIARGIMAMVQNRELKEGNSTKRVNCLELEISDAIEKRHKGGGHGGMFVPWSIRHAMDSDLEKKYPKLFEASQRSAAVRGEMFGQRVGLTGSLDTKTTAAGGALVFVEPGEFIQFLYNRMWVKALGARTITGLRDNVAYPKQTGRATGSWVAENPGTDVTNTALTLAQIPSSPKTYQSSTAYSRQLLAQSVIDVDTLVREDLATDLALAVDSAAISGTGTLQPLGILNTTGVQLYVMIDDSGNGGHVTWKDVTMMTQKLEEVNADQLGAGAWLTTPGVKTVMKNTARLSNTIALPIWADDNTVDGYEARSTNQVPSNGTKGTGTNLHTLIRGIFETMVVSMWGNGFELVVDPYLYKKQGMIELTTFMMCDVTLKYPSAFVVSKYIALT
jgi:HK97 family phage major capsid protein